MMILSHCPRTNRCPYPLRSTIAHCTSSAFCPGFLTAGACGYEWENYVLEYFGANINDSSQRRSDFENFCFQDVNKTTQNQYFGQKWFEICVFMEHNFRNAIAPIHYRIFQLDNAKPVNSLQGTVKTLYNQRQSLFNQRSCFEGLRFRAPDGAIMPNGASFLSFQRFDAARHSNMNLRERIFSQLHNESFSA